MGNNADNLALYAAISCGSELVITNKTGYDEEHVIKELIKNEIVYNKRHAIVIASEKILDVEKLAQRISEETGFSGRSIKSVTMIRVLKHTNIVIRVPNRITYNIFIK